MLDSGAFKDIPGLLNYTVIIGQSITKVKGDVSLYNKYTLQVTNNN